MSPRACRLRIVAAATAGLSGRMPCAIARISACCWRGVSVTLGIILGAQDLADALKGDAHLRADRGQRVTVGPRQRRRLAQRLALGLGAHDECLPFAVARRDQTRSEERRVGK